MSFDTSDEGEEEEDEGSLVGGSMVVKRFSAIPAISSINLSGLGTSLFVTKDQEIDLSILQTIHKIGYFE